MVAQAKQLPTRTQVLIIGGGPSGATAATLLAQQGLQVTVLEREHFPRFQIGESLIPETYWVLQRLNMLPKLNQSHFVRKESVQFISADGAASQPFYFTQNKPGEQSRTWQVRRSEFDEMMLNNAREHGANCFEGVRVLDVIFDGDRATGVRCLDESGVPHEIRAEVVVDASGQTTLLASKLKLRVVDQELKKGSVWTYWRGAQRDPGIDEGATLVMQTVDKRGWFWYIPLHDNIVSVGVVSDFEYLFDKSRGDHEAIYMAELERCPGAKQRVQNAERATPFYATKDFSYRSSEIAGDGWVMIGDAFGFLDPLYSSGVLLALKSGQLAADNIAEAFQLRDFSKAQLSKWGPNFTKGMDRMRRLVCEYNDGFNFVALSKRIPPLKAKSLIC